VLSSGTSWGDAAVEGATNFVVFTGSYLADELDYLVSVRII
jgi:hypothetical protein